MTYEATPGPLMTVSAVQIMNHFYEHAFVDKTTRLVTMLQDINSMLRFWNLPLFVTDYVDYYRSQVLCHPVSSCVVLLDPLSSFVLCPQVVCQVSLVHVQVCGQKN